ncbi:MAG: septum site-determining protein MinC [Armatimonadota bacterium]
MPAQELVKFKGTRHGLLISFNEDENLSRILEEFKDKINDNGSFFRNAPISLDLGWREVNNDDFTSLYDFLNNNELKLTGIISSSAYTRGIAESYGIKVIIGRLGLAQHEGRIKKQKEKQKSSLEEKVNDKEKSILIKKTLRSGQKIKYQGNVVIVGDVNPGAEVEAGGDIVVWGSVRGIVHAGAYGQRDDSCVIAMNIIPAQMRIGDGFALIRYEKKLDDKSLKVARLKGPEILVSNYNK